MSIIKKKEAKRKVEDFFNSIVEALESDRHFPSIPQAGDAPTDNALDSAMLELKGLIKYVLSEGFSYDDLFGQITFDDIIIELNKQTGSDEPIDICDELDEMREIDSFVRYSGETKYRYVNTVYEHKPTGRFVCVERQQCVKTDCVCSQTARETVKEQRISYEWSSI